MQFVPLIVMGVVALIVIGLVWYVITRFLVNVGAQEVAIKERRYLGKRMPQGRVVATEGEVGIQADVLKPGLHFVWYPVEQVVRKVPLVEIGADELGVIEAIDGEPMQTGSIFAPDRAQNAHNNFQDPIAFIKQGGVKGIQLRTLPPGKWAIHPFLFNVSVAKATVVPPGKIGVMTSADGAQLEPGRLHASAIEGHKNFQDAESFVYNGGQKGPQVETLTPGTYRIHTASVSIDGSNEQKPGLFYVRLYDATVISENQIGLVEALDGAPLDPRDYVAQAVTGHDNFQAPNTFITGGGQRGPQKDILLPGTYYINPLMFKVIMESAKEVKPGEVAVIVSNVGKDPSEEIRREMARKIRERLEREEQEQMQIAVEKLDKVDGDNSSLEEIKAELASGDPAEKRLDSGAHEAYVVPEGFRGIQETVVGPGRYYVNTLAVSPIVIPTTNQTVEWTAGDVSNTFDPFEVISKDGFTMQLEVRVVFRVKPEDAPFMVAKIGDVSRLIQNVMHPLIDSIFRNQASESSAMAYLQNRHEEQERAEARVRMHLLKYHVDVVNVLICHIHLPEELMKTQTEKILAEQRQGMYDAQREAEIKRIELARTSSQADNQKSLMEATVGVEIAAKRSEQRKREADGEAYYISSTGRAEAEKMQLMGEAQGVAYREQVNALGANGVALVETLKVIGEKGVRITPDIMASGGNGDGGGGIGSLLLLNLFRDQMNKNSNGNSVPTTTPTNGKS
ncbi:MAG: SPFH domain-containing protein [Pyrinomonadaceae bacterium]